MVFCLTHFVIVSSRWREVAIAVGNTSFVFPLPAEVPGLMEAFGSWLSSRLDAMRGLSDAASLEDAFVLACEAHMRYVRSVVQCTHNELYHFSNAPSDLSTFTLLSTEMVARLVSS